MAEIQKKIKVPFGQTPHFFIDELITSFNLSPKAYMLFMYIWRYTAGFHRRSFLFNGSTASQKLCMNKRTLQRAKKELEDSMLIECLKPTRTGPAEVGIRAWILEKIYGEKPVSLGISVASDDSSTSDKNALSLGISVASDLGISVASLGEPKGKSLLNEKTQTKGGRGERFFIENRPHGWEAKMLTPDGLDSQLKKAFPEQMLGDLKYTLFEVHKFCPFELHKILSNVLLKAERIPVREPLIFFGNRFKEARRLLTIARQGRKAFLDGLKKAGRPMDHDLYRQLHLDYMVLGQRVIYWDQDPELIKNETINYFGENNVL